MKASCDEARVVGTLGYVLHRVFIREDSDGDAQARELPMVLVVSGGDFGRHGSGGGGAARL